MNYSFFRVIWLVAISAILTILPGLSPVQGAETAKDQVALVNGTVITRQELESEIRLAKNRLAAQGQPMTEDAVKKISQQILDQLIDMELLLQESQKQKVEATDAAVTEYVEKFKARFESTEAYEKALKELNISEADLKQKTKKGLTVQALIEKQVISKIDISDAECRDFYDSNPQFFKQPEKVQARHILIKSGPKDEKAQQEKALEKIKQVQKEIKAGGDFSTLAKKYSEGPSGKNGGDLGYFARGQMVKPFEDAAFGLEPGQTSDIVKTEFGYHLITVTGKKAASTTPYEEVKEKIRSHLKQQKTNERVKAYIESLKKGAAIEKSLQEIK